MTSSHPEDNRWVQRGDNGTIFTPMNPFCLAANTSLSSQVLFKPPELYFKILLKYPKKRNM